MIVIDPYSAALFFSTVFTYFALQKWLFRQRYNTLREQGYDDEEAKSYACRSRDALIKMRHDDAEGDRNYDPPAPDPDDLVYDIVRVRGGVEEYDLEVLASAIEETGRDMLQTMWSTGWDASPFLQFLEGIKSARWLRARSLWRGGLQQQLNELCSICCGPVEAETSNSTNPAGLELARQLYGSPQEEETGNRTIPAEASLEGEPSVEKPTDAAEKELRRLSVEDANRKAMELAKKDRFFVRRSQREWAKAIGCSAGLVGKLPLWQETMRLSGRQKEGNAAAPKAVRFTPALEKSVGKSDEDLQRLIAEQEADYEPSPLEEDAPDSPRKVRSHVRL